MSASSWLYTGSTLLEGDSGGGWIRPLDAPLTELPSPALLLEQLDPSLFSQPNLSLLLEDDWLRPLRVELDQKPKHSELEMMLKWKLKRYLPYPIQEACVRFVPLLQPLHYLTYSLPQPWLDNLYELFMSKGVRCGYIGGLFSTLLEQSIRLRGGPVLALFPEFYQFAELDSRGNYVNFRSRRLPFGEHGHLDLESLAESDLAPLLSRPDSVIRTTQLLSFAPTRKAEATQLAHRLGLDPALVWHTQSPLKLFQSLALGVA